MPPTSPYYAVDTYYRTIGGGDLLKAKTPNSFRQQDIRILSKVAAGGDTMELDYYKDHSSNGVVKIYSGKYDDITDTTGNHIFIYLPKGILKPIETYVRLSPSIVDTITYTFAKGDDQFFPEKLFYNKKLAWDFTKTSSNNPLEPIVTIIK